MSFASVHSDSAELERYHAAPTSFAELVYPYTARVTRQDWQLLLDSWERLQPKDDPHELAERIDVIAHRYAGDSLGENDHAIRAAITAMLTEVSLARLTPDARQWWKAGYAIVDTIIRKGSRLRAHGRPTTLLRRTRLPNC